MKKILTITLILTGLLFIGCGEEIGMVDPIEVSNSSNSSASVSKEHMFNLPMPDSKLSTEGDLIYSQTETINGEKGGSIKMKLDYTSNYGNMVEVIAELKFAKDSFSGTQDVTLNLLVPIIKMWFSPRMSPLKIKLEYNSRNEGTGSNRD